MKKLIIYISIFILTCTACDEFLEQEPGSQTSIDEIFASYDGFKMALNGCYYDLEGILSGERIGVYADALGGNLSFTPSETKHNIFVPINIENIYSFTDVADDSDMYGAYNDFYDIVNSANQILERIPSLNDATDEQVSQLQAEVLCIRAFSHFYLVRLYAQNYSYTTNASHPGIICNTRVQIAGKDYPERLSVNDTYNIIMTDLQDAIDYFKSETILEGPEYSYFNINSCKALLARVALYAEDYEAALEYSSDVIQNSNIALMTKDEYVSEWEKPNTPVSEIIFELSAKIDNEGDYKTGNTLAGHYGVIFDTNNEVLEYKKYCINNDLMNLLEPEDVRSSNMFIQANLTTLSEGEAEVKLLPYVFTKKFQDNPGNPELRMSEMYLIQAEAYARLNEPTTALDVLNTLRLERGATLALETEDILEEIYLERRKELCFEGHLFFDIARFHKNVERDSDCIATTCNLNYPSNYFILPIPKRNIDLNSNLEQNEGYN